MQKEIDKIDRRLEELRVEYVNALDNRRKFIETGVKLLKEKRRRLVVLVENGL